MSLSKHEDDDILVDGSQTSISGILLSSMATTSIDV